MHLCMLRFQKGYNQLLLKQAQGLREILLCFQCVPVTPRVGEDDSRDKNSLGSSSMNCIRG